MAKTFSTMSMPLQAKAPAFSLPDVDGKMVSLSDFVGSKGYVVMFICNHCPYVVHIRDTMVRVAKEWQKQGLAVVAISSNDPVGYPEDAPEKMKEYAQRYGLSFPYLFDATQEVAKAYDAACTPDFYVFDAQQSLVYRGQMDDARPGNAKPNDAKDINLAIDTMLSGKGSVEKQTPSMGCKIKWK